MTAVVVEDEHPDTPRLAVPPQEEHRRSCVGCGVADAFRDRLQLRPRTATEERESDVHVGARNDPDIPDAAEGVPLPSLETLEGVVRETKTDEEA
jgi:hypothetical protein